MTTPFSQPTKLPDVPNLKSAIADLEARLENAMACKAFKLVYSLDGELSRKRAQLDDIAHRGDQAVERRRQREEAMRKWRPEVAPWVTAYEGTRPLNRRSLGVR